MAARFLVLVVLVLVVLVAAPMVLAGGAAEAREACTPAPERIRGAAHLSLREDRTGLPMAVSRVTIDVPLDWPPAADLLTEVPDQDDLRCLPLPPVSAAKDYSAVLSDEFVRVTVTTRAILGPDYPTDVWAVRLVRDVEVSFEPASVNPDLGHVSWTEVQVDIDAGLDVTGVHPRPSTFEKDGQFSWVRIRTGDAAGMPRFGFRADPLMRWRFDPGGGAYYAVFIGGYGTIFAAVILAVLRRRRAERSSGGHRSRDDRIDLGGAALWASAAMLVYSALQIVDAYVRQVPATITSAAVVGPSLMSAVCLGSLRSPRWRWWRWGPIALLVTTWALVPGHAKFTVARTLLLCLLLGTMTAVAILLSTTFTAGTRFKALPRAATARLARFTVVISLVVSVLSLPLALRIDLTGSVIHLLQLYVLLVLVLLLVADASRSLAAVASRRLIVVLVLTLATLEGMRWGFYGYADALLPVLALAGCAVSIVALTGNERPRTGRSRVAFLEDLGGLGWNEPAGLRRLQTGLVKAHERLNDIATERRSWDAQILTGTMTAEEKVRRSARLEAEIAGLRRVPPETFRSYRPGDANTGESEAADPVDASSARDFVVVGGGAREGRRSPLELPKRMSPLDLAFALGPHANGPLNALTAVSILSVLALGPGIFFVVDRLADEPQQLVFAFRLEVVLSEFLYWTCLGLCVGLLWPLLPGRRGSTKALFFWLAVAAPTVLFVGVVAGVSDQSITQGLLLRSLVLGALVMATGLAMDLVVLFRAAQPVRPVLGSFVAYYRLNKVIPTISLMIPLTVALLGIWNQLDQSPVAPNAPVNATNGSTEE